MRPMLFPKVSPGLKRVFTNRETRFYAIWPNLQAGRPASRLRPQQMLMICRYSGPCRTTTTACCKQAIDCTSSCGFFRISRQGRSSDSFGKQFGRSFGTIEELAGPNSGRAWSLYRRGPTIRWKYGRRANCRPREPKYARRDSNPQPLVPKTSALSN